LKKILFMALESLENIGLRVGGYGGLKTPVNSGSKTILFGDPKMEVNSGLRKAIFTGQTVTSHGLTKRGYIDSSNGRTASSLPADLPLWRQADKLETPIQPRQFFKRMPYGHVGATSAGPLPTPIKPVPGKETRGRDQPGS
jgi:hypothetical protein